MNTQNPYAPPRGAVEDISDQTDGLVLASRGGRLGAAILDSLIIGVFFYVPLLVGVFISGGFTTLAAQGEPDPAAIMSTFGIGALLGLVGAIAWAWITIRYVLQNGQTIAKRMIGIKVVRRDGSRASLGRIFWLRNVVNILLSMIPLYGVIDSLLIFGDTRQCLHDKLADTIVVNA